MNFLTAICSNPHVSVMKVKIRDVNALYSHLDGPRVAKKNPQPPVALLAKLERAAWREIAIHVHGDMALKQTPCASGQHPLAIGTLFQRTPHTHHLRSCTHLVAGGLGVEER